jgi:hypothetical protein
MHVSFLMMYPVMLQAVKSYIQLYSFPHNVQGRCVHACTNQASIARYGVLVRDSVGPKASVSPDYEGRNRK